MDQENTPIGKAGGEARAKKLTPERRKAIAEKAAASRWAHEKGIPRAEWEGEMKIGTVSMRCAVLSPESPDSPPRRVISETEFMKALGMYRSGALSVRREQSDDGAQIPLSLAHKNLKPFILNHLGDVHYQPMKVLYRGGRVGHGISADLIPKVCEIWMDASKAGVLGETQKKIAAMAEVILRGLAHIGIIALIDEATGYQDVRDRQALQTILDKYITDEWAKWTRRFDPEFYRQLFRLKGIPFPTISGTKKPSYVGHWTNDLVYSRLAPGVLNRLREVNPRVASGNRARKHHQHLTEDIGAPELQQHLSNVTFLMKTCRTWEEFKARLDLASPKFGDTMRLDLGI
jgi:hypothetical protein